MPGIWIGHLELDWELPEYRAFFGSLAETHTVIRYDRLGTGLSDREARAATVDAELDNVVDALGLDEFSLLGVSFGGCAALAYAARAPREVDQLALFGAFAHGDAIAPAPLREALAHRPRALGRRARACCPTSGCPARAPRCATGSRGSSGSRPPPRSPHRRSRRSTRSTSATGSHRSPHPRS